ncbi:hypothetical protein AVEN_241121-1 [Araneus ventricosus]|uniref:Uncharacterized protein n=1 Tax=Araneus ventricosus TaxID=182803 RepID=A0A4Y2PN81_ARAVE|nr:hypothetical protein AVEN_241121-1 [Araneus ventricosus]
MCRTRRTLMIVIKPPAFPDIGLKHGMVENIKDGRKLRVPSSTKIPRGLVVRIPGSHPGGPGSIPGVGSFNGAALAPSSGVCCGVK